MKTHATSDEEFLDLVFERALEAVESGDAMRLADLISGREHLLRDVERLLEAARVTACAVCDALPRVTGYESESELGRGGMGTVYLARQQSLGGRRVALKFLPAAAATSAGQRARFMGEARALASVRHPNVVAVYDVLESMQHCAYAMECIDGLTLGQLITRVGQVCAGRAPNRSDLERVLALGAARAGESYCAFVCRTGISIARALGAMHRAGLVHRDVKPSNVLLRKDGTALLSDFGLAHASESALTKSGLFVGTVAYASPEQLEGGPESLDARSDVYALGVTIYHALALHLPFETSGRRDRGDSTPTGMLRLIESRKATPLRQRNPDVTLDLETIVAKTLDPERAARYASADELADDLERLLSLQPIRARRAGPIERGMKFARRHRGATIGLAIGGALSFALVALVSVYLFLVPGWVDERVRSARVALLDPRQANAVFVRELWGTQSGLPTDVVSVESLESALEQYDSALRLSPFDRALRDEREAVSRVLNDEGLDGWEDLRNVGLAAYLRGEVDMALRDWGRWEESREALAAPDPLAEAALGLLHLVRDQPERAYPRLREAVQEFPGVAFMSVYLADAAVRCGDFAFAERILEASRSMPLQDPLAGRERVLAALYAATARDVLAEELYARSDAGTPFRLHYARFLRVRGRREEAVRAYVSCAEQLRSVLVQREIADALDEWWRGLPLSARRERVLSVLDLPRAGECSFVVRLRARSVAARTVGEPSVPERRRPAGFADISGGRSSSSLESLGLSELAEVMEVENMKLWNVLSRCPRALRCLQLAAWALTAQRTLHPLLRIVVSAAAPLVAAVATFGSAAAQGCPDGRYSSGLSFDSARNVVVMFGGAGATSLLQDTWEWDGVSWTQKLVAGPSARHGFTAMPYDSARGVSVLFGGETADSGANHWNDETWEWNGLAWSQRIVSGPSRRQHHGIAYDSARGVTVLFGGFGPYGFHGSDTWEWNGTTWTQRTSVNAPSGRMVGCMTYDVARGVCVLFGGYVNNGPVLGDTWEWDGTDWVQRFPAHSPSARTLSAFCYDSVRGVSVLFGGWNGSIATSDTWEWNGVDWVQTAGGRPERSAGSGVFDSARNRFLAVGGLSYSPQVYYGDTWVYDGATHGWCQVAICPQMSTFCTAGTTTSGCSASIYANGTPSVAAASGFTIGCSNVEGQRFGLIFYGLCGPKSSSWAPGSSSYLCVKSPVQRTPADNSGGTNGGCDGWFAIDFLTYISTHPNALGQPLNAGQVVTAQSWFRDPPAAGTTNLSNGLQFTTVP